jgi:hypothetical protein
VFFNLKKVFLIFQPGGGQFPASVNPEIIDPNDYHEDRPSFSSGEKKIQNILHFIML